MIAGLKKYIPGVQFNGESENIDKSLYTILMFHQLILLKCYLKTWIF